MRRKSNRRRISIYLTLFFALLILCQANTLFAQSGVVTPKKSKVEVLEEYPHSRLSYTQGLFFYKGTMYESCGEYGRSNFKIVDYKSGKVLRQWKFRRKYFLEGSCAVGDNVYILTWHEKSCFVYTIPPVKKTTDNDFKQIGVATYNTEGWGLTFGNSELIMSDGSDKLYFLDPSSFYCKRTLSVTINGKPLYYINELEYIEGKIWANVYTSDYIVVINPQTGVVERIIDCTSLLPASLRSSTTDVLNGIAYNEEDGSVYITGKNWPRLYRIKKD